MNLKTGKRNLQLCVLIGFLASVSTDNNLLNLGKLAKDSNSKVSRTYHSNYRDVGGDILSVRGEDKQVKGDQEAKIDIQRDLFKHSTNKDTADRRKYRNYALRHGSKRQQLSGQGPEPGQYRRVPQFGQRGGPGGSNGVRGIDAGKSYISRVDGSNQPSDQSDDTEQGRRSINYVQHYSPGRGYFYVPEVKKELLGEIKAMGNNDDDIERTKGDSSSNLDPDAPGYQVKSNVANNGDGLGMGLGGDLGQLRGNDLEIGEGVEDMINREEERSGGGETGIMAAGIALNAITVILLLVFLILRVCATKNKR